MALKNNNVIKVAVADPSFLVREGLRSVIENNTSGIIVQEFEDGEDLKKKASSLKSDLLIFDFQALNLDENFINTLKRKLPNLKILCLTNDVSSVKIELIMRSGIHGYIFKDCDKQEIIDFVNTTYRGEHFFCGKVMEALTELEKGNKTNYSCKGLVISAREAQIIGLIAEGLTNKEIADKLFLSSHTVNTHRKKIMSKLGIGNTAGLVMYAIKENLIHA